MKLYTSVKTIIIGIACIAALGCDEQTAIDTQPAITATAPTPVKQLAPATPTLNAATTNSVPGPTTFIASAEIAVATTHCAVQTPTVRWISDQNDLNKLVIETQQQGTPIDMLSPVEFGEEQAVLVAMGTQPTPGYNISLVRDETSAAGDTLTLHVQWIEPNTDRAMVQLITTPCIVVKLPNGDQKTVVVIDQNGTERMRATKP